MIKQWVAIAAGGSVGALMRFWVANGIYQWLGRDFPHGTLFVNVSGCFLMGLLTELMLQRSAFPVEYRAAVLVGFLGAYTTFSTFAMETLYLFEEGSLLKALLNTFLSVALCLSAVWIGAVVGRKMVLNEALLPFAGSGPLVFAALGMIAALCAGFVVEVWLPRLPSLLPHRAAVAVLTLAAVTAWTSLRVAWSNGDGVIDHQQLLQWFAANALADAIAMGAGMNLGKHL